MNNNKKIFNGIIDGKSTKSFIQDLNTEFNQQERLEEVFGRLYPDGQLHNFFVEYFDKSFKSTGNKAEVYMSEDDSVCHALEILASYLLFPGDYDRKSSDYVKDNVMDKQSKKCLSLERLNEDTGGTYEPSIDPMSIYKVKEIKIYKEDINKHETLKQMQDEIDKLRVYNKLPTTTSKQERKNRVIIGDIKFAQKEYKNCVDQPIICKSYHQDISHIDYSLLDDLDETQVIKALYIPKMNLLTDLGGVYYDIQRAINYSDIDNFEYNIIEMLREEYTHEEIGKTFGLKQSTITERIKKIAKKITKANYSIYESWYYLNKSKGVYKTCNKCGETLIMNEIYFNRDAKSSDGFKNPCKMCIKSANSIKAPINKCSRVTV